MELPTLKAVDICLQNSKKLQVNNIENQSCPSEKKQSFSYTKTRLLDGMHK